MITGERGRDPLTQRGKKSTYELGDTESFVGSRQLGKRLRQFFQLTCRGEKGDETRENLKGCSRGGGRT